MADDPATRIALVLLVLAVALAAILLTLRRSKRRAERAAYEARITGLVATALRRHEERLRALGVEPQRDAHPPDTPR